MSISRHCETYQLPSRQTVAANGRFMPLLFHIPGLNWTSAFVSSHRTCLAESDKTSLTLCVVKRDQLPREPCRTLSSVAQMEVQDHIARNRLVTDPGRSEAPLLGSVDCQVCQPILIREQLYSRDLAGSLNTHLDADRTFSSECGAHV